MRLIKVAPRAGRPPSPPSRRAARGLGAIWRLDDNNVEKISFFPRPPPAPSPTRVEVISRGRPNGRPSHDKGRRVVPPHTRPVSLGGYKAHQATCRAGSSRERLVALAGESKHRDVCEICSQSPSQSASSRQTGTTCNSEAHYNGPAPWLGNPFHQKANIAVA